MQYKCKQFVYTDSVLDYKGEHSETNATDDEGYWKITKFTYSGDDLTKIQIAWGENINWTDRADYFN